MFLHNTITAILLHYKVSPAVFVLTIVTGLFFFLIGLLLKNLNTGVLLAVMHLIRFPLPYVHKEIRQL